MQEAPGDAPNPSQPPGGRLSEDALAMGCAALLLAVSLAGVWSQTSFQEDASGQRRVHAANPLESWVGKPAKWTDSPAEAFVSGAGVDSEWSSLVGVVGALAILASVLGLAVGLRDGAGAVGSFLAAFVGLAVLATLAYTMAAHSVVKAYSLSYALWALLVGMILSNTTGVPRWLRPAVQTELYIKAGLVLLGAEVLLPRLLALGVPGVFVAWVVTPIVLISTYAFGQRVLRMESRSLNMVISADMSVCGVSAAIAAAAACRAKKEELSLAIGMSLSFTVQMMVVLPIAIRAMGLDETVGGAWLGGTIDSTGAVAAAGAALGDRALEVAATVKMIQNILIGASAFGIAAYWVTYVETDPTAGRPGLSEVWRRFPRFVLGFLAASIFFSLVHALAPGGPEITGAVIHGSTKTLRGWLFCLAFVSIGLETNFRDLAPHLRGGKPLVLYACGQSLNLVLTLVMAYLMFGVVFKDFVQ